MTHRCALCGHVPSDHADGILGAAIDDVALCHTDDHSCYMAVTVHRVPLPTGFMKITRTVRDALTGETQR